MNQPFNILRKDAAQLLPQLLMPMFTLALFTLLESRSWTPGPMLLFSTPALTNVLAMLFSMTWAILILSLIQAERLVGVNQFWTTRPYEWPSLIAAKGMFLIAFLYLPLIASQIVLLHEAHLAILASLPALARNLLLFTCALVLPAACGASLTRHLVHAIMALVGILTVLVAVAFFSDFKDLAPRMLAPLQMFLLAASIVAAILHQYRTRATTRSLVLLAIAPALILLLQIAVPGTPLAAVEYRPPAGPAPVSVAFDSNPLRIFALPARSIQNPADPLRAVVASYFSDPAMNLFLHLPLLVSATGPKAGFALDGHRISLQSANGYAWRSPWLSMSGMLAPPPGSAPFPGVAEFAIPKSVYRRLGDGAVTLRIEFALTQLDDQPPTRTTLSTSGEPIPGLGFCALDESYSEVTCRSAFHNPPRFDIVSSTRSGPCTAPNAATDPALTSVGDSAASTQPHIASVDLTEVRLTFARAGYLCPGAPVSFTEKRAGRRIRIETPPATIRLSDYTGAVKTK
jgi:hypothetical protein